MSINQLKQLTVRNQSLILNVEAVRAIGLTCSSLYNYGQTLLEFQNISQATGITTTVNCGPNSKSNVIITTQSASTVANSYTGFVLQNTQIQATSVIKATILSYTGTYGTNGLPLAFSYAVSAGQCEIGIMNTGNTALAGTFKILVEIIDELPPI
jgi:hypothetical protein